jgi:hypothetical protein
MAKGEFWKSLRQNTMALICLIIALLMFIPNLVTKLLPDIGESVLMFYVIHN